MNRTGGEHCAPNARPTVRILGNFFGGDGTRGVWGKGDPHRSSVLNTIQTGALFRLNVLYTVINHIEHSGFNVDRDKGIRRGCRDERKLSSSHQRGGGIKDIAQSQKVRKDVAAWLV